MPVLRIPLVGSLTSRDNVNTALFGSSQKDQYFEDCAFHLSRNSLTGNPSVKVGPRESFSLFGTPTGASGNGTAVFVWRGKGITNHVSAFGSTNSTIYVNSSSLGAITGLAVHISEAIIGTTPNLLIVSASNKAYFYPDGGALTEITDGQFPSNNSLTITGPFAFMDGRAFIMTTKGEIWQSDLNSLSAWSDLASITAQEYPDAGVAVIRHKHYIIGFSQYSMEFFPNTGNEVGSTLTREKSLVRQVGLVNQYCVKSVLDTVVWVGRDLASFGVYILNGGSPERISTEEIDYLIDNVADPATIRLHILSSHSKRYVGLAISENTSNLYVYDFETKIWQLWTLEYAIRQSDAAGGGTAYVGQDATEIIYNSGSGFASAVIQTAPLDLGSTNRKRLKRFRLIGDKAVTTSNVVVTHSDDDYQNFSQAKTLDMAALNPQMYRCGTFRKRAYRLSGVNVADTNREQRLEAMEFEYDEGVL